MLSTFFHQHKILVYFFYKKKKQEQPYKKILIFVIQLSEAKYNPKDCKDC